MSRQSSTTSPSANVLMAKSFTQKWAIVSLLEDVTEGSEFHYTEFPLHVTLAGVFATSKSEHELAAELATLVKNQHAVDVKATHKDLFGPSRDIAVMRLEETPALIQFYTLIHTWLKGIGVTYNSPQYEGQGYLPHSTFQKSGKLTAGEKRRLTSVSLIDLYPHSNGYSRKIAKTILLPPN